MRGLAWRPGGEGCGGENKDVNVPWSRASLGRARSWHAGGYLARSRDTRTRVITDARTHSGTTRMRSHAYTDIHRDSTDMRALPRTRGHGQTRTRTEARGWRGHGDTNAGCGGARSAAARGRCDPTHGSVPWGRGRSGEQDPRPGSGIPRSAGPPGSGIFRGSGVSGKQDPRGPRPTGVGPLWEQDPGRSGTPGEAGLGASSARRPPSIPGGSPKAPSPLPWHGVGWGRPPSLLCPQARGIPPAGPKPGHGASSLAKPN